VARDPAFGDLVLCAYLLQRSILIGLGAGLRIAGSRHSPDARRVRDFAARDRLPCRWLDVVVQNHLLQVLALVAMDPPVGTSADDTQDKKAEIFRAMPPADPRPYVRGRYQGYTDVPRRGPGSTTKTFVALRLEIDNRRWADVPIFVRAGKALPDRATEVRLLLPARTAVSELGQRGLPVVKFTKPLGEEPA
jgi:hypothetical protein